MRSWRGWPPRWSRRSGILVLCSCSHAVGVEAFHGACVEGAAQGRAGRRADPLGPGGARPPGACRPARDGIPEGAVLPAGLMAWRAVAHPPHAPARRQPAKRASPAASPLRGRRTRRARRGGCAGDARLPRRLRALSRRCPRAAARRGRGGAVRAALVGRVLDEWRIAVAAKQGIGAEDEARGGAGGYGGAFSGGARRAGARRVEAAIRLPDPADAHVLAAAVAGGAGHPGDLQPARLPAPGAGGARDRGAPPGRLPVGTAERRARAGWGRSSRPRWRAPASAPGRARAALKRANLPRLGKAVAGAARGAG